MRTRNLLTNPPLAIFFWKSFAGNITLPSRLILAQSITNMRTPLAEAPNSELDLKLEFNLSHSYKAQKYSGPNPNLISPQALPV
ncbi:MAG: hypothetical protein ABGY95_03030 [Rubritalea sp.]|uniref:hypothetical protein n=1 Tax=Rubritalea sp. TaxID=2109375 RepID=UPI003241D784